MSLKTNITNRLLPLVAFICAFLLLWGTTPNGLGLSPDSIGYIKAATGLINGFGFKLFSSEWPPLYPLLIAMISKVIKINPEQAARCLQAILFSSNLILSYLILRKTVKKFPVLNILLCGLLVLQNNITYVNFYAWSEPLLLFFSLLNIVLLQNFVIKNRSNKNSNYLFILLIITSTCALFTKFLGYAICITNATCILIFLCPHYNLCTVVDAPC